MHILVAIPAQFIACTIILLWSKDHTHSGPCVFCTCTQWTTYCYFTLHIMHDSTIYQSLEHCTWTYLLCLPLSIDIIIVYKDFSRKGVREMPEVATVFHSIFLFFFITLNFKFLKNWKIDSLIPFLFYRIQYVLLPGGLSPIIDFSNTYKRPSVS